MRISSSVLRIAACASLLLGGCARPSANPRSPEGALADAALKPLVERGRFTGAVVLGRHGRVLYERGIGLAQRERGVPFTPDTPSDGGSLAKTLTAAAVHLLVAEGRLDLDAPVIRYLPTFPNAGTTLRHLVTHTNGLPDYEYFEGHFPPGRARHTADLLAVLAKTRFEPPFRPGSRFEYGNLGFDLAGLVVEKVTGQAFPAFLGQRFLDPLGMRDTFARPALFADWPGVRTLAYRPPPRQDEVFDVFEGEGFIGASNLYFTARDLHRWVSAFATGRGLPQSVLEAAAAPVLLDGKESGIRKGNWYCDGAVRCYYTGNINGFYGFAYWDRGTGDTAAYLTNCTFQGWDTPIFERALIQAARGGPSSGPAGPESFEVHGRPALVGIDSKARPALAGRYRTRDGTSVDVTLNPDDGRFRLRWADGLAYTLFEISPDTLYLPGLDAVVGFSGPPEARVLHFRSPLRVADAPRDGDRQ